MDVGGATVAEGGEVDDRIGDELTGAVIGDAAAAVGVGGPRSPAPVPASPIGARAGRCAAPSLDRRVLEQEQGVGDLAAPAAPPRADPAARRLRVGDEPEAARASGSTIPQSRSRRPRGPGSAGFGAALDRPQHPVDEQDVSAGAEHADPVEPRPCGRSSPASRADRERCPGSRSIRKTTAYCENRWRPASASITGAIARITVKPGAFRRGGGDRRWRWSPRRRPAPRSGGLRPIEACSRVGKSAAQAASAGASISMRARRSAAAPRAARRSSAGSGFPFGGGASADPHRAHSAKNTGSSSKSRSLRQESRPVGAVEDAVVAGQGDGHPVAGDDLAVADDRHLVDRSDREDRRLRRVDHGREVVDPEHPQVGHGEGSAGQLRRRDRPVAHPRRQRPRLGGDLAQPLASASNTVGTTRASCAATAMPTLTREYSSNLPSR